MAGPRVASHDVAMWRYGRGTAICKRMMNGLEFNGKDLCLVSDALLPAFVPE